MQFVEFSTSRRQSTSHKNSAFLRKLEEEGVVTNTRSQGQSQESEPELFFDAVPLWNAFRELSPSRQSGFSIGYIPYSEISSWLDEQHILNQEERIYYRKFIVFIDEIWVNCLSEKQTQKTQTKR